MRCSSSSRSSLSSLCETLVREECVSPSDGEMEDALARFEKERRGRLFVAKFPDDEKEDDFFFDANNAEEGVLLSSSISSSSSSSSSSSCAVVSLVVFALPFPFFVNKRRQLNKKSPTILLAEKCHVGTFFEIFFTRFSSVLFVSLFCVLCLPFSWRTMNLCFLRTLALMMRHHHHHHHHLERARAQTERNRKMREDSLRLARTFSYSWTKCDDDDDDA